MSTIDTRSSFFPNSRKTPTVDSARPGQVGEIGAGNSPERASEISARTGGDAKVNIPEGVKDFSRIKKTANAAPEMDNSEKIAALKAKIAAGQYEMDYDAIADKMLQSEF